MVAAALPTAPGVQTTEKPVVVTAVEARQLPPCKATATVGGKLVPVKVNVVATPVFALVGAIPVTVIVPAAVL